MEYFELVDTLDWSSVESDLEALFTDSQDWWPADYGHYGPFFIRLAWHCAGSYRNADGRGGCEGGRQRFDPERSWDDNTNLDKARTLLRPIKLKYGTGLSWGDLFILAGTQAIKAMGGPKLGFCAGRVDDYDGTESLALGPTPYQELIAPCPIKGNCTARVPGGTELGTNQVGLIYVNPEGFMGVPEPSGSVAQIRETFGRMGMNDTETVALIGGGHAFGKTHGACPAGAGKPPSEDPVDPWAGNCPGGTFTSGFEGPWTTTPTQFNTEYFTNLLDFTWQKHVGPGGHWQWNVTGNNRPAAPGGEEVMMLTADQALLVDPSYRSIVEQFAADQDYFSAAFGAAWYKLTTRDMGPVARCRGPDVPPAQPFQNPLPAPPTNLPDFTAVASDVKALLTTESDELDFDASMTYAPILVRLAWQCANTFRATDYQGGCNGARIRLAPENAWTNNQHLNKALNVLESVKVKYGDSLTWADLIVLAGNVAIEASAANAGFTIAVPFTGGRSDADETTQPTPSYLESRLTGGRDFSATGVTTMDIMKDTAQVMGLTNREYVALIGGGHSLGHMHNARSGFVTGAWTTTPKALDIQYFTNLLSLDYSPVAGTDETHKQWQTTSSDGSTLYMLQTDMALKWDSELSAHAADFGESDGAEEFYEHFVAAWTKVMNADLFLEEAGADDDDIDDGSAMMTTTAMATGTDDTTVMIIGAAIGGLVLGALVTGIVAATVCGQRRATVSKRISTHITTRTSIPRDDAGTKEDKM